MISCFANVLPSRFFFGLQGSFVFFHPLSRQEHPCCLECGKEIFEKDVFRDVFAEREVKFAEIYCENADEGCNWTGICDCDLLQAHLNDECAYHTVRCDLCGISKKKKDVRAHGYVP